MANPRTNRRPEEGETRFGTARIPIRGAFYVQSSAKVLSVVGNPAVLLLDSVADDGTVKTWGLWVDSGGKFRIVEIGDADIAAVITNEDGSGTVVGSQS